MWRDAGRDCHRKWADPNAATEGGPPERALRYAPFGFLTNMNPPPARASTPTMNDAVARRSWFVAMNTPPTMQMTTPTAIRIMAVVRFDDCLLDPVAELMLPPRCFAPAGSPGRGRRGSFLTHRRYYLLPPPTRQFRPPPKVS